LDGDEKAIIVGVLSVGKTCLLICLRDSEFVEDQVAMVADLLKELIGSLFPKSCSQPKMLSHPLDFFIDLTQSFVNVFRLDPTFFDHLIRPIPLISISPFGKPFLNLFQPFSIFVDILRLSNLPDSHNLTESASSHKKLPLVIRTRPSIACHSDSSGK
jgi:hypothetical protein